MRNFVLAAILMVGAPVGALAQTAPAPAAAKVAAPGYSVEDTDIGTLLDDPAAKAILDKHMPGFSTRDQIDMARSMTLKSIQQYAPDQLTDQVLADIQVDFSKLPAKK